MNFPVELSLKVDKLKGDIVECGVWKGATFKHLARRNPNKTCHAIDSFTGFRYEPSILDDQKKYYVGRFSTDVAKLQADCERYKNTIIHEGYIPEVLSEVKIVNGISFIHLDLDLYTPTKHALHWCWPLINKGGIISCHDFYSVNFNASEAIRDFIKKNELKYEIFESIEGRWAWFVK